MGQNRVYRGEELSAVSMKSTVKGYWEEEPCTTRGVDESDRKAYFDQIERKRYALEPRIPLFARWERGRDKKVLEIGVGAGTDHVNWARAGALLAGIDLTEAGIELTRERLALEGLSSDLRVADSENLPFEDGTFDIVYSYGVLHHTPNTEKALAEVHRVLKPGGTALIMLYNLRAWTSWNLWAMHCLMKFRPWKSPRWAVYNFLESPGTKAYTEKESGDLFTAYSTVEMDTSFLGGDLLTMERSAKYSGLLPRILFALFPRPLVRALGPRFGFARNIEAVK